VPTVPLCVSTVGPTDPIYGLLGGHDEAVAKRSHHDVLYRTRYRARD
jgi:hypothetical protein